MTLAVSIPSEVEAKLAAKAKSMGLDTATFAAQVLQAEAVRIEADTDNTTPRRSLKDFVGAVAIGHPHSLDNEKIDADLAREYGNEND